MAISCSPTEIPIDFVLVISGKQTCTVLGMPYILCGSHQDNGIKVWLMKWYKGKDRILLSFCFARLKRDDSTFLWELWERAENTTASDDANLTTGTLMASLGGRNQGCKRSTKGGPGLVHSAIHPLPSCLAQGYTPGQYSVDSCWKKW